MLSLAGERYEDLFEGRPRIYENLVEFLKEPGRQDPDDDAELENAMWDDKTYQGPVYPYLRQVLEHPQLERQS